MEVSINILGITGASGFIGAHLTRLLAAGDSPAVFSGNIGKPEDIDAFFARKNVTTLIHLAGLHDGAPGDLMNINVMPVLSLCELGMKHGLKRIVFASSGAVYGNVQDDTGAREGDPCRPVNGYGLSKLLAEDMLTYFARKFGIDCIILRLGTVYGPGQKNGIIPAMRDSLSRDHTVYIDKDRAITRQFIHVSDVCTVIESATRMNRIHILNTASDERYTLEAVAAMFTDEKKIIRHSAADNPYTDMKLNTQALQSVSGRIIIHRLADYIHSL